MNKLKIAIFALAFVCFNINLMAQTPSMTSDCSTMGPDMQAFAAQCNPANKAMFCSKFNDAQRAAAMQFAGQQNVTGGTMMTADQAVQKIARENNMMPNQKTPTGCPVK